MSHEHDGWGREELCLRGEIRRKEEAESQKEKQLERNGKHGRDGREVAVPTPEPIVMPLRGRRTPQLRHRCVKVQKLKSTSISVPFPTSPGIVTICPLGLRPEKNGTMKASTVLTTCSDSDKNLPEPPRRRLEVFFVAALQLQPYGRQDQSKHSRGFLRSDSWNTYSHLITQVPKAEKREKGNMRTETRM